MPPKLPLLVGLLDALKIKKNSTLWNEFLGAAARDRLEPIDVAGVTYLSRENALHGLSDSKEKGPQEMSLIEAASEIGNLSASCCIKKITVTASDGSEYFFYISEQE